MIIVLLTVALVPLLGLFIKIKPSAILGFSVGIFAATSLHLLLSSEYLILFPVGFLLFYLSEKFIWRHCHEDRCKIHPITHLTLFGDAIHSAVNGIIISSAFHVSTLSGIITTFAILIHAIPHQMGNLSLLLYGGFNRKRAVILNTLSSSAVLIGAFVDFDPSLVLPFAAGGFAYISTSDFVIRNTKITQILAGFVLIFTLSLFFPG